MEPQNVGHTMSLLRMNNLPAHVPLSFDSATRDAPEITETQSEIQVRLFGSRQLNSRRDGVTNKRHFVFQFELKLRQRRTAWRKMQLRFMKISGHTYPDGATCLGEMLPRREIIVREHFRNDW